MNKAIKELVKETGKAFELVTQDIQEKFSPDGWREINKFTFASKNIVVERITTNGRNYYLNYFDETLTYVHAIVVPPDFLLKEVKPSPKIQKLLKKYEEIKLANLVNSCGFTGNIGSDPEIFCETAKGKLIPAFEFLPSKEKPLKVPGYHEDYKTGHPSNEATGNTLYWDGFQAEFTTRASHCMGWHGDSLQAGLRGLYEALRKHDKTATLSVKTVFDIPAKMLKAAPSECVAFGCNPSLNVYGMRGLEMPGTAIDYRSAGGHIHLGYQATNDTYQVMVKAMDAILGVAGVSLCAKYDDPRRRIMYGLAGEYRLPPHGLEYRVLSNAWLFHPVLANIVFDLARGAAMFGKGGLLKYWEATEAETIECINTCNVKMAREILSRNEKMFKNILNIKLQNKPCVDYAHKAIMNGLESIIKDPTDIVGNWGLTKPWKGHCDGKDKNVHFTIGNGGSGGEKKI